MARKTRKTSTVRIATVTETNEMFIVIRFDIRTGKVTCRGDILSGGGKTSSFRHGDNKVFNRSEITLEEKTWTIALHNMFIDQAAQKRGARRTRGHNYIVDVDTSGRPLNI